MMTASCCMVVPFIASPAGNWKGPGRETFAVI
jgi:hypothetical protein